MVRIWFWVYFKKIPGYPIFHLLKGDYTVNLKPHILSTPGGLYFYSIVVCIFFSIIPILLKADYRV